MTRSRNNWPAVAGTSVVHGDDLSLGLVLGLKVLDPLPGSALGLVEQVPAAGAYLSTAEAVSSEEASSCFVCRYSLCWSITR